MEYAMHDAGTNNVVCHTCRTLPEIEEMLLLPEESWPSRTQALLAGSARHRNTHQQNGSLNAHQQQEHDNIEQKTDTEAGDGQQ